MRPRSAQIMLAALLIAVGSAGCSRYTYAPASRAQPQPQKKSSYELNELARRIHERVNTVRAKRDKEKLSWNATLARVAQDHSQAMSNQDFFAHENPEGQDPTARAEEADFSCRVQEGNRTYTGIAENIFYTYPYRSYEVTTRGDHATTQYQWKDADELAREIVQGWLDNPGHRRNLLNARHQSEGLGLARAEDDEGRERIYVTQNLC